MKFIDILEFAKFFGFDGVSITDIVYNNCQVYQPVFVDKPSDAKPDMWILCDGNKLDMVSGDEGVYINQIASAKRCIAR